MVGGVVNSGVDTWLYARQPEGGERPGNSDREI